jgi:hypothetical protein
MVVRFNVELWHDNHIVGEYALAIDMERYIERPDEDDGEIKFDLVAFQQQVTNEAANLQFAGALSDKLRGLEWTVGTEAELNETDTNGAES